MKKLAIAALACVLFAVAWRARSSDGDTQLLYDRFWVDHAPRDAKERFYALVVSSKHPVGHVAEQTQWTGRWEGFHYHVQPRDESALELIYPHRGDREVVRFRARRCSEKGFDFCLETDGGSRTARRYYSKKEWQVGGAEALPFAVDDAEP